MNIQLKDLEMKYTSGKIAVHNVNLLIQSPGMIGLLGPNGAGKTTLMKLIVSALQPTSGEILIDNQKLKNSEWSLKKRLGYLPQSVGLFEELTVYQFLEYMGTLKGIHNIKDEVNDVINVTNLEDKRKTKIKALSGGQRQRVGIAQAVLGKPELLILDEPTVGLDPEERISFRNYFSDYSQKNMVMLSTHIIEDVQAVCNKLIIMNHGEILFAGTQSSLIQQVSKKLSVENSSGNMLPLEEAYLYCIRRDGDLS